MQLYLVRHGQSQANIGLDIFDPRLTDLGLTQAERTGKYLSGIPFSRIYGSTLARSAQTAAAIASAQKKAPAALELLPELVETGTPSDFAGDTAFLQSLYPETILHQAPPLFPSDEARAKHVLETYVFKPAYEEGFDENTVDGDGRVVQNRSGCICMVSHGVFTAHLMAQLVHFPFDPDMVVSLHNAGVCRFSFYVVDGVRRIKFITHNDTIHLRKDMLT